MEMEMPRFARLLSICCLLIFMISPYPAGAGKSPMAGNAQDVIRIALIHLDARPGEVEHNRQQIEAAIKEAVANGANWIVTPELAETGYRFTERIGTDWIEPFPSRWVKRLSMMAKQHNAALFIGIAEKDITSAKLHNSVVVIGRDGVIMGTYRKHRVVNGPAERWAARGSENSLFMVDGIPVGLLICADSYKPEQAMRYAAMGAKILISPANWPPHGSMGPKDYWEKRSKESGLPLIVNNRTGREPKLDFRLGESVLALAGSRLYSFKSEITRVFYLDWNPTANTFTSPENNAARK